MFEDSAVMRAYRQLNAPGAFPRPKAAIDWWWLHVTKEEILAELGNINTNNSHHSIRSRPHCCLLPLFSYTLAAFTLIFA